MRILLLIAIIAFIAWLGYSKHRVQALREEPAFVGVDASTRNDEPVSFKCDGRTYCSQMTSCAEAKFFLTNCPNTKMDGDHDGIPCEQQWCN